MDGYDECSSETQREGKRKEKSVKTEASFVLSTIVAPPISDTTCRRHRSLKSWERKPKNGREDKKVRPCLWPDAIVGTVNFLAQDMSISNQLDNGGV